MSHPPQRSAEKSFLQGLHSIVYRVQYFSIHCRTGAKGRHRPERIQAVESRGTADILREGKVSSTIFSMTMDPNVSIQEANAEEQGFSISPCLTFRCADNCCKYGADVEIEEYHNLIANRLATPGDFTGPEEDENGFLLYRTALGPRGCIFLLPERGCRLHNTAFKPDVCKVFPRDDAEALEAYEDGYLPCVEEGLIARRLIPPKIPAAKDRT
jgi:Fe-S-cluster containining protein